MKYLYDVWINWFEGEEHGYNVCAYHEWRKNDKIDILEQVPTLYITEALFAYIENSLHPLPEAFLEKIHKRAYIRKGVSRRVLEYACIVTDGKRVLAINTLGYQIPIQKSRLIPRQERQVLESCQKEKRAFFPFTPVKHDSDVGLFAMQECHVLGLTRRERQLKKILLIGLDKIRLTENRNEILYWLAEWDIQMVQSIGENATIEDVWKKLYDSVQKGWSDAHERLCAQIIKGNAFLEKYWELENEDSHNPSHERN